MLRIRRNVVYVMLALLGGVSAFAESPAKLLAFRADYAPALPVLSQFVARYTTQSVNTLYIGKIADTGEQSAYAYWKEDQSVLILIPHFIPPVDENDFGWLHRKARIDLDQDVVPTKADVGSSTYLVDRPWVNKIIDACLRGEKLLMDRSGQLIKP